MRYEPGSSQSDSDGTDDYKDCLMKRDLSSEPGNETDSTAPPRYWHELDKDMQTQLLIEYGHYLDTLPPTCSMQAKNERFTHWLAQRNIVYKDNAS